MKPVTKSDIKSEVLDKINAGEIRMKPKIYFLFIWLFSILGIVSSAVISAYLLSITIFWLRIHTANTMAYGARANLKEAIDLFPWLSISGAVLAFIITALLIQRHGTLYRHRFIQIGGAALLVSLIFGIIISYATIWDAVHKKSERTERQMTPTQTHNIIYPPETVAHYYR
jgi:glucan phosphoethanolaminetransferase (alkaline phosphatase superfamily)